MFCLIVSDVKNIYFNPELTHSGYPEVLTYYSLNFRFSFVNLLFTEFSEIAILLICFGSMCKFIEGEGYTEPSSSFHSVSCGYVLEHF